MTTDLSKLYDALSTGLKPDLDLTVDEWSDRFMVIPKSSGSNEYGSYRTKRTPHARYIMRALSDSHHCKRVICKVASQMFKTQIALNWFGATVHQSPSNFLWLMPTGKLHKRIAARIDKTIASVPVLTERVAKPGSRDAQNNQDTKEYVGGALFIATAGAAANLAEVPARRVAFDEIDRAESNVDGEGDPVKLAEARQTTFAHNKKSYYYSSPTIQDESRIDDLFRQGTQRHALAECIHCGHAQTLVFENLILSDDKQSAFYPCIECGGIHKESDKQRMFEKGLWSDGVAGDGETESFTANSMFLPYGWLSWRDLMREYENAKILLDAGNDEQMIVFYNTRLARCWERQKEATKYDELMARAEDYRLSTMPDGVVFLTAAIDTQVDRLELMVVGWGVMMECWIVDYRIILGDPSEITTWNQAHDIIVSEYSGKRIKNTLVDSGGHHTQEVYDFSRRNKHNGVVAIKGDSQYNRPIIPSRPATVDFNFKGEYIRKGISLWKIGTDTAKNYLHARWKKPTGYGAVHFSKDLPEEFYKQLVAEYRVTKYINGKKKTVWDKKRGDRNEAGDLMVYNLAAAYKLGLHRLTEEQWNTKISKTKTKKTEEDTTQAPEPPQKQQQQPQPPRRKRVKLKPKNFNPGNW